MAFQSNAQRNEQNDTSWKASGFLNLYLPGQDGKRRKLGAIALRDSKPAERKLVEWLTADPTRAAKILAKLEIDYQSAKPNEAAGFAVE